MVLRDGHTVRVRPITASDDRGLIRFHERQSPESVYFRFFAPRPRLSERDVAAFTNVDHADRVAFVAELDGEIVGVARYERYVGSDTAEVAFFIDDDHHGRGLATVMLEYLAAAARERGLRRFVATTLPANRKMLAVFAHAGYEVATHMEDGVIDVAFDIDPTRESVAAQERRERQAEAMSVRRLLEPTSLAVMAGRHLPDSPASSVVMGVLAGGFTGELTVVGTHDTAEASAGVIRATELPAGVDLVIIATPAEHVRDLVDACGERGAGGVMILSSGFGPTAADEVDATGGRGCPRPPSRDARHRARLPRPRQHLPGGSAPGGGRPAPSAGRRHRGAVRIGLPGRRLDRSVQPLGHGCLHADGSWTSSRCGRRRPPELLDRRPRDPCGAVVPVGDRPPAALRPGGPRRVAEQAGDGPSHDDDRARHHLVAGRRCATGRGHVPPDGSGGGGHGRRDDRHRPAGRPPGHTFGTRGGGDRQLGRVRGAGDGLVHRGRPADRDRRRPGRGHGRNRGWRTARSRIR